MTNVDSPCQRLVHKWRVLYTSTLPSLAKQRGWPVHLDHCFARIIYDAVIGDDGPWTERMKSPATIHMSGSQMEQCIAIAERLATAELDLGEWNRLSLEKRRRARLRNNHSLAEEAKEEGMKQREEDEARSPNNQDIENPKKRKRKANAPEQRHDIRAYFPKSSSDPPSPPSTPESPQVIPSATASSTNLSRSAKLPPANLPTSTTLLVSSPPSPSSASILQKIHSAPLLPLHKALYTLLLQVPPGRYTTYAHLATALNTSPRAVGSAMRNNPFALEVPCHRVLASGGKIGGFSGEWGAGKKIERKVETLRAEGVRFDGKGVAVGGAWRGFRGRGDEV